MSAAIIEYNGVDIFQSKNLVLNDISFSVFPGEFVYLIGRTGSGKSSIMKTLYGEVEIKKGLARIGDQNLVGLKSKYIPKLRRKIGVVFQDFQLLLDRNVSDNLLFVLKATGWRNRQKMDIRIREVLEKVEMNSMAHKMPNQLSGGEQQRVAIARALLNDPEIILADEPTGNLDPITTEEILHLLHEISETGKAILMATHDYNYISRYAKRILKCENGKLQQLEGVNSENQA